MTIAPVLVGVRNTFIPGQTIALGRSLPFFISKVKKQTVTTLAVSISSRDRYGFFVEKTRRGLRREKEKVNLKLKSKSD